jgi:hypothetical protein
MRMAANAELVDQLGLPDEAAKKRVASAMSGAAEEQSKTITNHPFSNHIPDILVAIVLILAAWRVYRGTVAPVAQVVVTAPGGLMPFQIITASDLAEINKPSNSPSGALLKDVVGKYGTGRMARGDVVDTSKLSFAALPAKELDDRQIFRVKLQPSRVIEGLAMPVRVSLMVVPREKDVKPIVIENVYVLDAQSQPDAISAVVATKTADTQVLASLLARSDLVVVGPAR